MCQLQKYPPTEDQSAPWLLGPCIIEQLLFCLLGPSCRAESVGWVGQSLSFKWPILSTEDASHRDSCYLWGTEGNRVKFLKATSTSWRKLF